MFPYIHTHVRARTHTYPHPHKYAYFYISTRNTYHRTSRTVFLATMKLPVNSETADLSLQF